jgi:hypothetical protein
MRSSRCCRSGLFADPVLTHTGWAVGVDGIILGVVLVSMVAASSSDRHRAHLANAPTNAQYLRSSNLARTNRCITAKAIAAETPNMSAPFVASSGPSNRHDGVRSRSP